MGRSTDVKAKFISDTTAADADGLITSTTPGSGGAITLNGAQVSGGVASFGDNTARLITVHVLQILMQECLQLQELMQMEMH